MPGARQALHAARLLTQRHVTLTDEVPPHPPSADDGHLVAHASLCCTARHAPSTLDQFASAPVPAAHSPEPTLRGFNPDSQSSMTLGSALQSPGWLELELELELELNSPPAAAVVSVPSLAAVLGAAAPSTELSQTLRRHERAFPTTPTEPPLAASRVEGVLTRA